MDTFYPWKAKSLNFLKYAFVITVTLVTLFPFYWMILTSLRRPDMLYSNELFSLKGLTFGHYIEVWTRSQFPKNVANSVLVSTVSTLFCIALSCLSGYALSRFKFRWKKLYDRGLLLVYMFPTVVVAIPLFIAMRTYGLLDTYFSLIVAYTTFSLPFCIWMLRSFFDGVPTDLEEAAMIDGCSRLQILCRIVLPVALPGIAAVAIFTFLNAWKEFLFAQTFIQSSGKFTIPVGLRMFQQQYDARFDLIMSATTISTIPIVVFFFFMERFLVEGLTAGATKG